MAEQQKRVQRAHAERETPTTDGVPETRAAPGAPGDEKGSSAARRLKQDLEATAQDLEREAEERVDRWTTTMGRQAESLARALRAARDSLWTEGEERVASVVGQAADQVDRMSGYLEDEDPAAMLDDLAELGRRNPGAFLGSAFTLGMAAGRFLRASAPERADGHAEAHASTPSVEARR